MISPAEIRRLFNSNRPFGLLLASLAVSSCGDWLYNVALLAFVYERTGSATWVAVTTTARVLPMLLLGPFGGALADRFDRRRLMLGSDLARALLIGGLALVVALDGPAAAAPLLAALATAAGVATPPCVAACTARLVPAEERQAANGLRAAIGQAAIVVGPALGALLLALAGPALAIALDALTFLASFAAIAAIPAGPAFAPAREAAAERPNLLADVAVGARALRGSPIAVRLVAADVVCSAVYGVLTVTLVMVAGRIGAGGSGYGLLLAACGVGGIAGATAVGRFAAAREWRRTLAVALGTVGIATALLGAAPGIAAALALALLLGAGMVVAEVLSETALPNLLGDEVLARAYGLLLPAAVAGILAGSLVAGPLVALLGPFGALAATGLLVLLAGVLLLRPRPSLGALRPAPVVLGLALALTAVLALGSGRAAAAITTTHITTPATTTFEIENQDEPLVQLAVAGTTDSTDPSHDTVDIYCSGGGYDQLVAASVPLAADGSFATEIGGPSVFGTCRLRAVPSGPGVPADPSPFTGPVDARGTGWSYKVSGGPNEGETYSFVVFDQQLSAADQFDSAGSCGLSGSYLYNAAWEETTNTFVCDDYFWYVADEGEEATSRSELQVDGRNAYMPASARAIDDEASGLPQVTYSYRQDPTDGDLTLTETDPLVECPSQAFPPTEASCPSFVPTGVVDTRTVEQTEDGHLVWITDSYASEDGEAHQLDLLDQQQVRFFGFPPSGPSTPLGFRFPGETEYAPHTLGDVVNLGDEAPGTVYIRRSTVDGDTATGRGAIIFDRPASSATFNVEEGVESGFYLHQDATVPADGSTSFRYAFAQGYEQSEVEALAAKAETAFGKPAAPPATEPPAAQPPSTQGSPGPAGTNHGPARTNPGPATPPAAGHLGIGKVKLDRAHGTAHVKVIAPGPGEITLSGANVRTVRRRVATSGPVLLTVRPTPALAATLRRRGHASARVTIALTPDGGSTSTRTLKVKLALAGPPGRRHT
jgi:MFS family permease